MKLPTFLLLCLSAPVLSSPHYAGGDYHSNLIQLGIRDINPRLARFTTPDRANQFYSGYTYGADAPVTYADPSGAMIGDLALTEYVMKINEETQGATAATTEHTTLLDSSRSEHTARGQSLLLFRQDHVVRKQVPPWLMHHQEMLKRSTEHSEKIKAQLEHTKWLRSKMSPVSLNIVRRFLLNRKITQLTVELAQNDNWVEYYQSETSRYHAGIPGSPVSTLSDPEGESWILEHANEDVPNHLLGIKTETPEGFQNPRLNVTQKLRAWLNRQR